LTCARTTMHYVKRRDRIARAEQLSVFEGLEAVDAAIRHEPSPDTMRQIVSLRMPDALLERVEAAARGRGVSPSSLMRALIAAGLDRSYAAVAESDVAAELAALRRRLDDIAERLPAAPMSSQPTMVSLTEPLTDLTDAGA
jgi:ribbon-helix-helix CopG family protein